MKRSELNVIMQQSADFLARMQFLLPAFAFWTSDAWRDKGPECAEIVQSQLGWDITDFGSGDFGRVGLFMFTIRNGTMAELRNPLGKVYAEKVLIVREGQVTPTHFHFQKMEDIINRGGGNLMIQLWNSTPEQGLAESDVSVSVDGVRQVLPAGGTLVLRPGDSVCLTQHLYHRFWGQEQTGTVLVGEVSRVNDDRVDNRFLDPIGRFPEIEEDAEPLYLLYNDYQRYYRPDIVAAGQS
jgi:D-lyxose ketol-isomerase